MPDRDFRIIGHGSDLAIEMRGTDLLACLAAGVEGFAAAVGEVAGQAAREQHALSVRGVEPTALLVELFGELVALVDVDGVLPIDLSGLRVRDDGWDAMLEVVPLESVEVHGVAPKAATWHRTGLEEGEEGWWGRVTLDL